MRSTLKKSLYLGLAALSFASVAGAANNADAAKKTKPAKTYATASYQPIADQGQSNIAYNVTGSNALFNKPGTVKGAKQTASKATMSDLASSKQNFMVYQTATTNRGSKYIKVVSFDKQYRGWIYAGNNTSSGYGTGVQRVNLSTPASAQSGSVYLANPGQTTLKNSPEGAQFNASQNTFGHTGFVAQDAFSVDQAQTVSRTGTTWYHIINQKDNTINGWVPSNQVQSSSDNNYFDKNNDIQVNYTYNGQTVKSSIINVSNVNKRSGYNNGVLDPNAGSNGLANAINNNSDSVLNNSGYAMNYTGAGNSSGKFNTSSNNDTNQLSYVTAGNTVSVPVQPTNVNTVGSTFNFNVTNGYQSNALSGVNLPSVNKDYLNQAYGYSSLQQVDTGKLLGNYATTSDSATADSNGVKPYLFNPTQASNGNSLGVLYGNTTYTNNNAAFNAIKDDSTVVNHAFDNSNNPTASGQALATNGSNTNSVSNNGQYHYVYVLNVDATTKANANKTYGQKLDLFYTQVTVAGPVNSNNTQTTNQY